MQRTCQYTDCDQPATVDTKTTQGPWAYLCDEHNLAIGCGIPALTNQLATIKE